MFLRKIRSNTKPNKREHQFISKTQLIEYLPPRFQIKTSFLLSEVSACVAHLFVSNGGNSLLLFLLAVGCWLLMIFLLLLLRQRVNCQKSVKAKIFNKIEKGKRQRRRSTDVPHTYLFIYLKTFFTFFLNQQTGN